MAASVWRDVSDRSASQTTLSPRVRYDERFRRCPSFNVGAVEW